MLTFNILFCESLAQTCTTPLQWQGTYAPTRIKQGSKTMAGWSNWCCLKIQRPLLNGATHISMNRPDWLLPANTPGPPCKNSQLQGQRGRSKTTLKTPFWERLHTQTSTQSLVRWLISFKVKADSKIKYQWWNFRPLLLIVLVSGFKFRRSQSCAGAQLLSLPVHAEVIVDVWCEANDALTSARFKPERSFSLASPAESSTAVFLPQPDTESISSQHFVISSAALAPCPVTHRVIKLQ